MNEDAELQAKIAALAARINREKQGSAPINNYASPAQQPARWSPYGHSAHYAHRGGYRGSTRGGIHKPGFRHRSLVNNNSAHGNDSKSGTATPEPEEKSKAGITTHDRGHMQWTNAAVYPKKVQAKLQAIEETAKAKRQAKDDDLKNRVLTHVYGDSTTASVPQATPTAPREILIRVFGEINDNMNSSTRSLSNADGSNRDPHSTPKEAKVAGVRFVRTKHGNLVRQGLLKNKRCDIYDAYRRSGGYSLHIDRVDAGLVKKRLCADFTSTGTRTLSRRTTHSGTSCLLEVPPSSKDNTDTSQVHAFMAIDASSSTTSLSSPSAKSFCDTAIVPLVRTATFLTSFPLIASLLVFISYARLAQSLIVPTLMHVLIPTPLSVKTLVEWATAKRVLSVCRKEKCRLPHIDRAGTLRKAAAAKAAKGEDDIAFDVSSDEENYEEIDSDDADSEEIEDDIVMSGPGDGHELSQQQDFIAFS
ncbi:Hypothetical protein D9617_2g053250 [Elsinoe fawcettii]|nr:Hypothetical protein D9617_2g053250 [Elsinoe fawcettii]